MTNDELLCSTALNSWNQVIDRASRKFDSFSNERLQEQVAPDRNRLIYLLGHLTVAHDRLFPLLRVGDRTHAELDAAFFDNPDGAVEHNFTPDEIRASWKNVNTALSEALAKLTPSEWLQRHSAVDEVAFQTEPLRNRLAILLSRTNHASFHLGQIVLAR